MSNTTINKRAGSSRDEHGPAESVIKTCLRLQKSAPVRGRLKRVFGLSPLNPEARGWYAAALSEIELTRSLERLGSGWTIMHAAGAGTIDSRVDLVAIGPAGVFAIVTKSLVGARVFASGSLFTSDGVKLPFLRVAEQVATHAAELIEAALDEKVEVTPIVVVSGAHSLTLGSARTIATVLEPIQVVPALTRHRRVLSDELLVRILRVAALRGTLHRDATRASDIPQYRRSFELLQHEVDAASHRARVWASAGTLLLLLSLTSFLVKVLPALVLNR